MSNTQTQTNHAAPAASALPPTTSRQRERPAGDEEADAKLSLGEFSGVPCLSLSEARVLINTIMDKRRKTSVEQGAGGRVDETEVLVKTQDYLDLFARFKQKESVEAVERLLQQHTELEAFERCQLGTLCCGDGEEALALIPSLAAKFSKPELDELTREIWNLRNFIEGP